MCNSKKTEIKPHFLCFLLLSSQFIHSNAWNLHIYSLIHTLANVLPKQRVAYSLSAPSHALLLATKRSTKR